MPFGEQAHFRCDKDTVLNGDPSEIQKNAVEVNEDVLTYLRVFPVVNVKWREDRAALVNFATRDLAQELTHFIRIFGLVQAE